MPSFATSSKIWPKFNNKVFLILNLSKIILTKNVHLTYYSMKKNLERFGRFLTGSPNVSLQTLMTLLWTFSGRPGEVFGTILCLLHILYFTFLLKPCFRRFLCMSSVCFFWCGFCQEITKEIFWDNLLCSASFKVLFNHVKGRSIPQ